MTEEQAKEIIEQLEWIRSAVIQLAKNQQIIANIAAPNYEMDFIVNVVGDVAGDNLEKARENKG